MIRKIGHIFLSFIMLTATVGLTVSKHYCGTDMVSFHYLVDESCDMDMANMPVQSNHDNCDDDMNCCHTEFDSFQFLTDYVQTDELELAGNFHMELIAITCITGIINNGICYSLISFTQNYSPPVKAPSQSLLQTFRC
ncbi:MAG: hypothetical protein DRJ07_16755 [Bacteroidetes bacterium]|nr:MAG: hypothetical protein DRJ07_16755 [Bacteroidota bacterium]